MPAKGLRSTQPAPRTADALGMDQDIAQHLNIAADLIVQVTDLPSMGLSTAADTATLDELYRNATLGAWEHLGQARDLIAAAGRTTAAYDALIAQGGAPAGLTQALCALCAVVPEIQVVGGARANINLRPHAWLPRAFALGFAAMVVAGYFVVAAARAGLLW
jgi:hypothetical protein